MKRQSGLALLVAVVGCVIFPPRTADAAPAAPLPWAVRFDRSSVAAFPSFWQLGSPANLFSAPDPASHTAAPQQGATAPPPPPFEYSDAYRTRAKIHRIASFATLPLVGTQLILGQSLYDNATGGKKTAHAVVGTSIGALFGVNTVTGVWNLIEARKDPNKRGLRLAHGLLMLAADTGFVITTSLAPDDEGQGDRAAHRAWAFTSLGLATAGYLIMLFGGHS
jgi:hypothetical protein